MQHDPELRVENENISTRYRTELELSRKILREMRAVIDGRELEVLMFIFERVYTYGHDDHPISTEQFLNGVFKKDGGLVVPGVTMSRSLLFEAIKGLVRKGIVERDGGNPRRAAVYSINVNWTIESYANNRSIVQPSGLNSPAGRTQQSGIPDYNIENSNIENSNTGGRACAHPRGATESVNDMGIRDNVIASIAAATAKSHAGRAKKKTKGNASSYETMWKDAQLEHDPERRWFQWTMEQKSIFKKALDRGNIPQTDREAFIGFIVYGFNETMTSQFRGWKAAPTEPNVKFVSKHIEKFWTAFEDHRNPNRRLDRRIRDSGSIRATASAPKSDNVSSVRIEQLEQENARLREQAEAKAHSEAQARKSQRLKLIKPKPRSARTDDEFQWRD